MTSDVESVLKIRELERTLRIACQQADDILDRLLQLHEDMARPDDDLLDAMLVLRNQLDRATLPVPIPTEIPR